MKLFATIEPTAEEITTSLPGDTIIEHPNAVMDRVFTLPASPEVVWPWFRQLGKNRAGWYFPRSIERFIPQKRRGLRHIDPSLLNTKVGDRIDDWGGKNGYLELVQLDTNRAIVYRSERGRFKMSWVITMRPVGDATRVLIRLRLTSTGSGRFMKIGDIFDALTIAGLCAGLRERLEHSARNA